MFAKPLTLGLALSLAAGTMAGCTSTTPQNENVKQALKSEAQTALEEMVRSDPGVQQLVNEAHGYAIYPDASKAGLVVGAAYGRGEVYEQGKFIGYSTLNKASVGLQAGAMNYSQLIVFKTPEALNRFTRGQWAPAADASAVALKAGGAASATFKEGVVILINTRGGAMADLSLAGQKYNFEAGQR